jgi:hypothetical protein
MRGNASSFWLFCVSLRLDPDLVEYSLVSELSKFSTKKQSANARLTIHKSLRHSFLPSFNPNASVDFSSNVISPKDGEWINLAEKNCVMPISPKKTDSSKDLCCIVQFPPLCRGGLNYFLWELYLSAAAFIQCYAGHPSSSLVASATKIIVDSIAVIPSESSLCSGIFPVCAITRAPTDLGLCWKYMFLVSTFEMFRYDFRNILGQTNLF